MNSLRKFRQAAPGARSAQWLKWAKQDFRECGPNCVGGWVCLFLHEFYKDYPNG